MENNGHEYAKELHKRLRYSNLLSLAGDSSVDVFIHNDLTVLRHIEGRILDHRVTDDQGSLLVDAEGFVVMLDVGNITKVTYEPDEDHFTLRVQDRVTERFQPAIKPSEVVEYMADTLLDDLERAVDDEEETPRPDLGDRYVIDSDDWEAFTHEDEKEGGENTDE